MYKLDSALIIAYFLNIIYVKYICRLGTACHFLFGLTKFKKNTLFDVKARRYALEDIRSRYVHKYCLRSGLRVNALLPKIK